MTPDKYTLQERFVDVGNEHQLYVQDWGNPKAKNIFVFLHGGPGGSVKDNHRLLFNPDKQRVIFFDQRGCGHSTPFGSIEHNTTGYLVEDVEKILVTLDIKSCILVGGSWGSCLALAYALKYPKRVKAMAIRGIFTGSEAELQFIEKGQFQNFFPDTWYPLFARHTAQPSLRSVGLSYCQNLRRQPRRGQNLSLCILQYGKLADVAG